jgi:uncharacterized protein YgiM (DUF1202 family)
MNRMQKVSVVATHSPSQTPPIQVRPGDLLQVHERDDEWPAFVKVTTPAGGSGWIPSRHLSAAAGSATVITPYNTQELPGLPGDVLTVVERDDESGWHWCRNTQGQEGWIPVRSVEPI